MESINLFSGGMQHDISKLSQPKHTYPEAINFRPFTELGESNGSLVNIKGNQCQVKFPLLKSVYKLKVKILNSAVFTDTVKITVNGQQTANITINTSTTGLDLYNALILLNNCYENPAAVTPTFSVSWKDDYIVITQQPVYTSCTPVTPVVPTVVVTQTAGTNTLYYVKPDNTTQAGNIAYIDLSAGYNVIPIGSTFIINDIYIYTAIDDPAYTVGPPEVPVNDTFSKPGQIWKLTYDEVGLTSTLTLMYNSYLDFTKYHPIAPTATTARYESAIIQRLYWTDFYNKVRTINIADPQVMALHPKLLTLIPSVGFDVPILTSIIGGGLESGTYELCYRLKQSLGAITSFSTLSFPVNVTAGTINDIIGYEGSAGGSGKGIRWTLTNLDTTYDTIEYIIAFRSFYGDIAKIYSVLEEPIPNDGERVIDITSLNDAIDIPLEEFLAINSAFTHAKTVETKDNRLFWGNLKNKSSEINFDARAYRALTTNGGGLVNNDDIRLTNAGITTTNNSVYWANLTNNPKTNDCINNYYDGSGNWSADACYYKPGAAYDANGHPVLGGSGPNISYEFGTYSTILTTFSGGIGNADNSYNIYGGPDQSPPTPFRDTTNDATNTYTLINSIANSASENQVYINSAESSVKYPYLESILRGFQHEEIYRFGIQFFDLAGAPYFTEWIGDIKMPSHDDFNNNPDSIAAGYFGANPKFRSSFTTSNSGPIYGQTIYIKFRVDVSSVKDIISGYKIVRVDRKNISDKTILGYGPITQTYVEPAAAQPLNVFLPSCFRNINNILFPPVPLNSGYPWEPSADQYTWQSLSVDNGKNNANALNFKTMDCFDFVAGDIPGYTSGDKLLIRERIISRNYGSSGTNNVGYRKYFTDSEGWFGKDNGTGTPLTANLRPIEYPTQGPALDPWGWGGATYLSGFDTGEMPFWIHMYVSDISFTNVTNLNSGTYAKSLVGAQWCAGNQSVSLSGGSTYYNYACTYTGAYNDDHTKRPCYGASTLVLDVTGSSFDDALAPYSATASTNAGKLMCLYYRPNTNQYGGNTYAARSKNEYIACGSYIPINRDNTILDSVGDDNTILIINTLGGDTYTTYWDHQKAIKGVGELTPPTYKGYNGNSANYPGSVGGITTTYDANNSVTYFIPSTTFHNAELRTGRYINKSLTYGAYSDEDDNTYYDYHSNQANIVKYIPKPITFVDVTEWVNRIHYSEVKFNNELQDSWQAYKTNNFYDVEGNYGAIYSLAALKEQLYYIQERGFGYLYVNPITTITGDNGLPVTLGKGDIVEKHRYLALDVGTSHQWSVYKSTNSLTFLDVRSKKIYNFSGDSLVPVSDLLGQRNFVIKRLHNTIITNDNPVIGKGVMSTYDYFNNEFLYTFKNNTPTPNATNDENYTIAYSEPLKVFTGLYTFMPILYINNHRNLYSISSADTTKCWLHNKGVYGNFYGTQYVSSIKSIINDNPNITKTFNNLSWLTESVKDNTEWRDDLLIPSITTAQTYSDNVNYLTDTFKRVRCYNEYQNTDYITLSTTPVTGNLRKVEQQWNIQNFRNKVNYDTNPINTSSIFDPTILTKTTFGDRMRDKYMIVDLEYDNALNNRFVVHNINTKYLVSDR